MLYNIVELLFKVIVCEEKEKLYSSMKPLNYEIFFLYPSFKLIVSFEGTKKNEISEFFFRLIRHPSTKRSGCC